MQLHQNYPFSIRKGSKHINGRCLFVVDKLEKKDVRMVCCPTDEMVTDYSTKPTQGTLFVFQRNLILGTKYDEFRTHKEWCERILERHYLWDDEENDMLEI